MADGEIQEVLRLRQEHLRDSRLPLIDVDRDYWQLLRKRAPARLRPVFYRRDHAQWVPAFLVERLDSGGHRLLSLDPEWRLHRVKAKAQVQILPKAAGRRAELHAQAVELYQTLQKTIREALR